MKLYPIRRISYDTILDPYKRDKISSIKDLLISEWNDIGHQDYILASNLTVVSLRTRWHSKMTREEYYVANNIHVSRKRIKRGLYIEKYKYVPLGKLIVDNFKGIDVIHLKWHDRFK